jgi:hypothetical protein
MDKPLTCYSPRPHTKTHAFQLGHGWPQAQQCRQPHPHLLHSAGPSRCGATVAAAVTAAAAAVAAVGRVHALIGMQQGEAHQGCCSICHNVGAGQLLACAQALPAGWVQVWSWRQKHQRYQHL